MKRYIKNIVFMVLIAGLFTACKKDDLETEKVMQIVINGYNGGVNALQMSIDTTQYDAATANGKYIIGAASGIAQNFAYTYRSEKKRMLTLTDMVTQKVVYSKELPVNAPKGLFNYIFLDGKELEVTPPSADATTNKLGFYIYYPASNEPFDIFLYRVDNSTGQEFREYLARGVMQGQWVYVNYNATADFGTKALLGSSSVYFTKAGTTDQWAFDDDQNKSTISGNSMFLPTTIDKGLVQPYFIKPMTSSQGLAKMFFYPDRQ
ncbi:hypothetical protein [Pararcticibacter amylolyticus]|uniref:DUF4397 domain-containing protein n=1 Tax=Pararcticibacter amylolyticus TaxID=2173175 RepID=A0A2U2PKJ7_9SPHI|nr:hypothetical protein [Pararcticibacter amylolyticus]PWG81935.1 hypothetical protein DDR33_02570 [Pararcticibacter amylolyticus]